MNIINKLHILKDTVVIAHEKLSQNFWRGIFQALQKCIQESEDEKKLSSAYSFLAKHWPKMYEAGVDLEEIVQVLHPLDIIEQFEALQVAGAHLNIDQIVRSIPGGHGKIDLHRLHSLGADMDLIAIHDDSLEPCSLDEINDLIINGVSVQVTFDLSESLILDLAEHPDTLFEILNFFYAHGIDSGQIRKMINKIIPARFIDEPNLPYVSCLIDDIVEYSSSKWSSIGVKPNKYVRPWVHLHCDDYFGIDSDKTLTDLPEVVSVRDFIRYVGLPYIISKVNYLGQTMKQFIDLNFLPAGGNIDDLAKEANYAELQYDDPIDWLTLAYISEAGSKLINREKLLKYGNLSCYSGEDYSFVQNFMTNALANKFSDLSDNPFTE